MKCPGKKIVSSHVLFLAHLETAWSLICGRKDVGGGGAFGTFMISRSILELSD